MPTVPQDPGSSYRGPIYNYNYYLSPAFAESDYFASLDFPTGGASIIIYNLTSNLIMDFSMLDNYNVGITLSNSMNPTFSVSDQLQQLISLSTNTNPDFSVSDNPTMMRNTSSSMNPNFDMTDTLNVYKNLSASMNPDFSITSSFNGTLVYNMTSIINPSFSFSSNNGVVIGGMTCYMNPDFSFTSRTIGRGYTIKFDKSHYWSRQRDVAIIINIVQAS